MVWNVLYWGLEMSQTVACDVSSSACVKAKSKFHCAGGFDKLWMKEVSHGDLALSIEGSLPWRIKHCVIQGEGLEISQLGDVSDSSLHGVLK